MVPAKQRPLCARRSLLAPLAWFCARTTPVRPATLRVVAVPLDRRCSARLESAEATSTDVLLRYYLPRPRLPPAPTLTSRCSALTVVVKRAIQRAKSGLRTLPRTASLARVVAMAAMTLRSSSMCAPHLRRCARMVSALSPRSALSSPLALRSALCDVGLAPVPIPHALPKRSRAAVGSNDARTALVGASACSSMAVR